MARTAFSPNHKVSAHSRSGVLGVTRTLTRRGEVRWNAWGTDGTGASKRLYYGPSFDEACDARTQWEQQVKSCSL